MFPRELLPALQGLRAFRHMVRHAYELEIDPRRIEGVIENARRVAEEMERVCGHFCDRVEREMEG